MNHRILSFIFIGLLAAATCRAADWPAFRGNLERTGYSHERVGLPVGPALWRHGPVGPLVSSPSVRGGIVYIGARDSSLYAINSSNGALEWKRNVGGWIDASPLIIGNSVLASSRDGFIHLLGTAAGDKLGELCSEGLQLSSPAALADGTILTSVGHPLNAFYKFLPGERESRWPLFFTQPVYSSPAVSDNLTVFGGNDGNLYSVNLSERKIRWSLPTGGTTYLSTPAIDDSLVFFAPGDADRHVYAVRLSEGALYWKSAGNAALAKTRAVTASQMPTLFLNDLRRMSPPHRRKWLEHLQARDIGFAKMFSLEGRAAAASAGFVPADNSIRTSSVAVDSLRVYVIQRELGFTNDIDMIPQSRFTLLALDKATGAEAWRFTDYRASVILGYNSSPVVAGNKVFCGWGEGRVYALDSRTGARLWSDSLDGDIISSPAVSDRKVYFATMNGYVYAYALTETAAGESFARSTYCYPNPARGRISHLQVFVTKAASIRIVVFNMANKPVLRVRENLTAGQKFMYNWDLANVANGAYIAIVTAKYGDGGIDKKILKVGIVR